MQNQQSEQAKGLEEADIKLFEKFEKLAKAKYPITVKEFYNSTMNLMKMGYELGQSQPRSKQWVSVEESIQAAILHLTGTGIPADCREFFIEGIRFVFNSNSAPPNSNTPKSDYVSREKVIEILSEFHMYTLNKATLEDIQECITKIKELK